MSSNTLTEIDVAGSVLFLGSGFSQGARNIRNEELGTGKALKDELAQLLGADPNAYDLKTLSDEVASRPNLNLYQILYERFTVAALQKYQSDILRLPWLRIYTTNYDDAAEVGYHENHVQAPSYSYDDLKPKKLANRSIVHLHGVIRKANRDNVLQQLVLNENSYVRQHFEKSLWYDDFNRDLRFCSACFFIGYSLSDYHITALLMQNPRVRERTYFVTRDTDDQIFANRIAPYGELLPIGVEGFATLCYSLPAPTPVAGPHSLKAFRYLDPFKDKRTLAPPTPLEILNLVMTGTFNYQRCLSTLPAAKYVIPRQSLADEAVAELKQCRCLLIHSRLGNGKSIFLYILALKLAEEGYECFLCAQNPATLQQDVELLKTFPKCAIFFDSYNTAIDVIAQLTELPPGAKFIVAVRTGVQEVRFHEIQAKLPAPMRRVGLNELRPQDKRDFKELLDTAGVRTSDLEQVIDQCKDVREVVVSLYDNADIKRRIQSELAPLLADQSFKVVFIVSQLLKWVGEDVDAGFLRTVTRRDAYAEIARFKEFAIDVFSLDDDVLHVRSAIFSEYLIQNHFTTFDICECLYLILVEAAKRRRERRYQSVLSSLMQVSNLKRLLRNDPNYQISVSDLFDRLHAADEVNREPLFWLQYSILMIDADDLIAAERFLDTAYARAAASPGFQTYQIDTHALRLLLLIEERSNTPSVSRFDRIIEKLELVLSMIGDESHRPHAIRVVQGIEPFVAARASVLSVSEKNALLIECNRLFEHFRKLSVEVRGQTGSDSVRASVLRARQQLGA